MIRTGSIFFLLSLLGLYAWGQTAGRATVWHFGENAGIDFSSGTAVAISGPIKTQEGVASISDENGNFLFSTDGIKVYNRNFMVMPNGADLIGHFNATQSGVIVPNPANPQQYYIFTASAQVGAASLSVYSGIAYTLVDMSLAGGLGDVVASQKNVTLLSSAAEKITAVKHCNDTDYWVICHAWDSDAFYAYQLSAAGVSAPVISNIGSIYKNWDGSGKNLESIGYLKVSPNGKKLAAAICNRPNNDVEVFDFNNVTGAVTNVNFFPTEGYGYGLAFSPDNQKLYVSFLLGKIIQYDLLTGASYTLVDDGLMSWGAIQLAPDGKMYVTASQAPALSVIANPNGTGSACNFLQNSFPLLPNTVGTLGLPNFIDDFFVPTLYLGADTTLGCAGSNNLTLDAGVGWLSYLWSNGANTQTINVSTSGLYWVEVMSNCSTLVRDSIYIGEVSVQQNASICAGQTYTLPDGTVVSNAGTYTTTISSPSGCDTTFFTQLAVFQYATTDVFAQVCQGNVYNLPDGSQVSATGNYPTILTATSGCDSTVITHLTVSPTYQSTENIALCEGQTYTLPNGIVVNQTGSYFSTLQTLAGCDSIIQSEVTVSPISPPQITGSSEVCEKVPFSLQAVSSNAVAYQWNTGDTTQSITKSLLQSQPYTVIAYNSEGCVSLKDSIWVDVYANAVADFTFFPLAMTTPQPLTLASQSQNATAFSWSFGSGVWTTGETIVVPYPETADSLVVTLVADNKNHCTDTVQKTIYLENMFTPTAFSPNGDGINDIFSISHLGLSQASLHIYNRWGRQVYESQVVPLQWDGKSQGKSVAEGVYTFYVKGVGRSGKIYERSGTITIIY